MKYIVIGTIKKQSEVMKNSIVNANCSHSEQSIDFAIEINRARKKLVAEQD